MNYVVHGADVQAHLNGDLGLRPPEHEIAVEAVARFDVRTGETFRHGKSARY